MNKLFLSLALLSLMFSMACGSGNGSGGGNNPPPPSGNFSAASLNGQFVFQIKGFDLTALEDYRQAGVLNLDGNGNITGGFNDFSEGSGGIIQDTVTGSYTVRNDGLGTITLNSSTLGTFNLGITLVSSSKFYIIEGDNAQAAGVAEIQDPNAISSTPSGTFVYRMHTVGNVQGSTSTVAGFTIASGIVTGKEDVNRGGASSSLLTLSGSFNSPISSGRGTGTFNDTIVTTSFIYYIVDANNVRFISSDTGVLGLGRAEKQTGTPFNNASLSGGFAFGSNGDTISFIDNARTVGQFTSAGDGTINTTGGSFDSVQDGVAFTNVSLTGGNYAVGVTGHATLSLTSASGTVNITLWMVNTSRAFFIINDTGRIEDGTMDLQVGTPFSNASLNGQFAFVNDGFTNIDTFDRVGTLVSDGTGGLSLRYWLNVTGVPNTNPIFLTGTYTTAANGRVAGSVPTLSTNLVFYMVSSGNAYMLQNDTGTEIDGVMSLQQP